MDRQRPNRRGRRGAAAVEFALVLPLALLLLIGAADLGRFAHTRIAVANAARAGAGFASTTPFTTTSRPAWEAGIRQAVRGDLEQLRNFDANRLRVTIASATDAEDRQRVSVTVEYPFDLLLSRTPLGGSLPLQQTAVLPSIR
jgi:Flp pilus assembly protein TadG